ncbi:MAG: ribosome silencing factor [Alphaproteobacteria bacterium]|nr:ribosome silencing factor [Alphaproteobacteria bacterium]HCQ70616.1 ribosome silencing factor [Rhodospirillaceae bacterium]|tara:strand:+ start:27896 stop:28333 length:438 start_codon:yes stop_codon:yes gene_type:complete
MVCTVFYCPTKGKEISVIISHDKLSISCPQELKAFVEKSLDEDKAIDVVTIELDPNAALADYMIVASGTSSRHVLATAEKLKDRLLARGIKNIKLEGTENADWVIVDTGDLIVHLFRPEVRSFYNIEKMWSTPGQFDVVGAPQSA